MLAKRMNRSGYGGPGFVSLAIVLFVAAISVFAGGQAGAAPSVPAAGADAESSPVIVVGAAGGRFDQEAASELRRYLYELTGTLPRVAAISAPEAAAAGGGPKVLVGEESDNPALASLVADGALPDKAHAPATDGYAVKTLTYRGAPAIAVMGSSPIGTLYGAYRLLEQYGARFYIDQDALPPRTPFTVAQVNLAEQPSVSHRGLLPWHDYLNGPSAYSLPDFKSYIDQMVKMRMNTLMLHDYMGGYPGADIDEPFMSFSCNGKSFNGYLDTSVSNQRWGLASTTHPDVHERRHPGHDGGHDPGVPGASGRAGGKTAIGPADHRGLVR